MSGAVQGGDEPVPVRPRWMRRPELPARIAVAVAFLALAIDAVRLALEHAHGVTPIGVLAVAAGVALAPRLPRVGLAAMWAGLLLTTAGGWDPTVEYSALAFTLFALVVSGMRPTAPAVGSFVALTAAFVLYSVATGLPLLTTDYLAAIAGTVAAAALGTALRLQERYWAALEQHARDVVANREQLADRRVIEERVRIARDLHDVIGHQVAVVSVHLGAIEMTAGRDPAAMTTSLEAARGAVRSILADTQRTVAVLRSDSDDPAGAPAPGMAGIRSLVGSFEQIGLRVDASIDAATAAVDPLTGLTAYRVVQEALTNAQRHGAGTARLVVASEGAGVRITVENRIRTGGARSAGGGHGLTGMRERVQAVGGEIDVSEAGGDFLVIAAIGTDGGTGA